MNIEDEAAKLEEMALEEMERRFSAADEKYMGMLEKYVAGGFCETLARLAIYLGKERAERALGKLPEEMHAEIERQIDALGDEACRTDLYNRCKAKRVLEESGVSSEEMADSVIKDAGQDVLSAIYHEKDALFARNPVLMRSIVSNMFLLGDIVHLDDPTTQRVLQKLDTRTIVMALRGKDAEVVREKIFRNMSKPRLKMLEEEDSYMGPIRLSNVIDAQNKILEVIEHVRRNHDFNFIGKIKKLTDEQLEKAFVDFKEEHSRLRSWEHCFGQFTDAFKSGRRDEETADYLSLHLGFYLASWGMMRSSDLMGYDYKIHIPLVKAILDFPDLRGKNPEDFCDEQNGAALLGRLEKLYERVKDHCAQFCHAAAYEASGTLISKIMLGTLGIVPAYDAHVSGVLKAYDIATGDFSMESFRKFARYFTTNHTETVGRMTAEMQAICPLYTRTKVIDGLLWYVGK